MHNCFWGREGATQIGMSASGSSVISNGVFIWILPFHNIAVTALYVTVRGGQPAITISIGTFVELPLSL